MATGHVARLQESTESASTRDQTAWIAVMWQVFVRHENDDRRCTDNVFKNQYALLSVTEFWTRGRDMCTLRDTRTHTLFGAVRSEALPEQIRRYLPSKRCSNSHRM